jgi:hypothetical protein
MIGRVEREGRRTNAKLQLWSLPHGVFGMWSIEDGEQPQAAIGCERRMD